MVRFGVYRHLAIDLQVIEMAQAFAEIKEVGSLDIGQCLVFVHVRGKVGYLAMFPGT